MIISFQAPKYVFLETLLICFDFNNKYLIFLLYLEVVVFIVGQSSSIVNLFPLLKTA